MSVETSQVKRAPQMKRWAAAFVIAGCLVGASATTGLTQALSGFTLFGGPGRQNELNYRLDFNGIVNRSDRYHLSIPSSKMELAVTEFRIAYPDYFTGEFNPEEVEVRVDGDSLPIEEVQWDEDNGLISIYMQDPIPARTEVDLVLSDVKNPRRAGMYFFNASVRSPGDLPLMRYVGTWVISIGR